MHIISANKIKRIVRIVLTCWDEIFRINYVSQGTIFLFSVEKNRFNPSSLTCRYPVPIHRWAGARTPGLCRSSRRGTLPRRRRSPCPWPAAQTWTAEDNEAFIGVEFDGAIANTQILSTTSNHEAPHP